MNLRKTVTVVGLLAALGDVAEAQAVRRHGSPVQHGSPATAAIMRRQAPNGVPSAATVESRRPVPNGIPSEAMGAPNRVWVGRVFDSPRYMHPAYGWGYVSGGWFCPGERIPPWEANRRAWGNVARPFPPVGARGWGYYDAFAPQPPPGYMLVPTPPEPEAAATLRRAMTPEDPTDYRDGGKIPEKLKPEPPKPEPEKPMHKFSYNKCIARNQVPAEVKAALDDFYHAMGENDVVAYIEGQGNNQYIQVRRIGKGDMYQVGLRDFMSKPYSTMEDLRNLLFEVTSLWHGKSLFAVMNTTDTNYNATGCPAEFLK